MSAEVTTLINGEPSATVSAHDRGFLYGDGVFETIAVYHGAPLLWDRHMSRLVRGTQRLGIALPSTDVLQSEATRLCAGAERAVLKIVLTRGIGGRGYATYGISSPTRVLSVSPWPDYPTSFGHDGVSVILCETTLARHHRLAGIKHLNRLEQVLARAEWRTEYAEGLMRDEDGNIIEGTISNVFAVRNETLCTPDLSQSGVEGVMREEVLDAARRLGISSEVGRLTISDVDTAQELFLTNSLIGIWPVRQLNDREYSIGPSTRKLQQAVREAHCFDRH